MDGQGQSQNKARARWPWWVVGLGSLGWLLLRSGFRPHRLVYPCQRAALANASGFVGYLLSLVGSAHLGRWLRREVTPTRVLSLVLLILIPLGLHKSNAGISNHLRAESALPAWVSPSAVSDVFAVSDVPMPECSLDGGTLPATPPCNDPGYALHDEGVDALVDLMASKGTHFYQTALHPDGIVGANDIVVIKINNQWGGRGSGDGLGRLSTNTDVVKGLVWRILQHPDGFGGEVVVTENTQPISNTSWNITPANAQDTDQSFQDVADTFQSLGYAVSLYSWTSLNADRISGGSIGDSGYPAGEYIGGNLNDAYILLEDPAGSGIDELSYPKFRTAGGAYVSMRYGVWNGSSYDSDRLTLINLPVLKRHGMAGATAAWKNLIGFVTADGFGATSRYGDWDTMHDFYWGYTGGPNRDYGLLGRQIAMVRAPDLHLVDAIWVAYQSNYFGDAIRRDVLLASTDPFAVDWYASEHVLYPLTGSSDTSAARSGMFRSATRVNQNAAALTWPAGGDGYPYIDLLDDYDGGVGSSDEINQMNVYVTCPAVLMMPSVFLPFIVRSPE